MQRRFAHGFYGKQINRTSGRGARRDRRQAGRHGPHRGTRRCRNGSVWRVVEIMKRRNSMVQQESQVKIAETRRASRARDPRARRVKRRYAGLGDVVVVTIKDAIPPASEKGRGGQAVIVRTAKETSARTAPISVRRERRGAHHDEGEPAPRASSAGGPRAAREKVHEDRVAAPRYLT